MKLWELNSTQLRDSLITKIALLIGMCPFNQYFLRDTYGGKFTETDSNILYEWNRALRSFMPDPESKEFDIREMMLMCNKLYTYINKKNND